MSLTWVGQDDFAAGMLLGVAQEQLPGVGVERATNALFDDDGDVWRRGALARMSGPAPAPLTFDWSGVVGTSYIEIACTAAKTYRVQGDGTFAELAAVGLARPALGAVVADRIILPNGLIYNGSAVSTMVWPPILPAGTRHLGTAFDRLLVATGNVIALSAAGNPLSFAPTDYHRLPDGVVVQALWGIRDLVLVFTNYGLFSITGMAFDLTDDLGNAQHTVNRLTGEISLLAESGLADWAGVVVAPCIDRVFLIDGLSPPLAISDSIAAAYMEHVRHGHTPGGAKVFRNHYFLPWVDPDGAHELYVCRLNRPVRSRQIYYPWSTWSGYSDGICALDVDLQAAPLLRGVHHDGWRVDLTAALPPFGGLQAVSDPDGSHPLFDVATRDLPTGNGQPNHVRRLRLFYATRGEGTIEAAYSYGGVTQRYEDLSGSYADLNLDYTSYDALLHGVTPTHADWADGDRYWHVLDPRELPEPGVEPLVWNLRAAERQRFVRARFRSTDGIAQIKLRLVQFGVRPAAHQR